VGEWLKPADCKSAAPCGLRRFESSPVHHVLAGMYGSGVGRFGPAKKGSSAGRSGLDRRRAV